MVLNTSTVKVINTFSSDSIIYSLKCHLCENVEKVISTSWNIFRHSLIDCYSDKYSVW